MVRYDYFGNGGYFFENEKALGSTWVKPDSTASTEELYMATCMSRRLALE